MNTTELLIAARKKIATPDRWTKVALARDAKGDPTFPFDSDAVCWCIEGSLYSILKGQSYAIDNAMSVVNIAIGNPHLTVQLWNDRPERSHSDVMAVFDRAIAISEEISA